MKRIACALIGALLTSSVAAETVNVEYSRFYSHVKTG